MKRNERGSGLLIEMPDTRFTLLGSTVGHRFAKIAAGFWISESTAHAYTSAVVDLFAERAPGLLKTLGDHDLDSVLLDGTRRTGSSKVDLVDLRQHRAGGQHDRPVRQVLQGDAADSTPTCQAGGCASCPPRATSRSA